jgi:hypothetical protein
MQLLRSILVLMFLSISPLSNGDVLEVDGIIVNGQTGHNISPKGQIVFESDEYDSTSHAIMTGHVLNADDEGALEFFFKHYDGISRQASADFTRLIDSGFGAGDFWSARVVRAIHINSGARGDTVPFAAYDGNSVRFLLGPTYTLPWNIPPLADNMAVFGEDQQLQIMPLHYSGNTLLQSYDVSLEQFKPLLINASIVNFGYGNIQIENPAPPATSNSNCRRGEISWDADYIYVCISENIWRRSNLQSW